MCVLGFQVIVFTVYIQNGGCLDIIEFSCLLFFLIWLIWCPGHVWRFQPLHSSKGARPSNKAFLRQWRNKVSVSCESIISGCIFYHAMSLIKLVPFFLWTASYAVQTLPPLFFLLVFPSELMVVKTKCWYPQWEIYSERQTGLFLVNKYLIDISQVNNSNSDFD